MSSLTLVLTSFLLLPPFLVSSSHLISSLSHFSPCFLSHISFDLLSSLLSLSALLCYCKNLLYYIKLYHLILSFSQSCSAQDQLALTLGALNSDAPRSSRDSLHCSSGYSTQTTTPSCSEDTIHTHSELLFGWLHPRWSNYTSCLT